MKLGEASRDEAEVAQAAKAEAVRTEKLRTYETDHLCLKCSHEPVCAVVASIKTIGGEGDVVISSCGAFHKEGPTLEDLMAAADGEVIE